MFIIYYNTESSLSPAVPSELNYASQFPENNKQYPYLLLVFHIVSAPIHRGPCPVSILNYCQCDVRLWYVTEILHQPGSLGILGWQKAGWHWVSCLNSCVTVHPAGTKQQILMPDIFQPLLIYYCTKATKKKKKKDNKLTLPTSLLESYILHCNLAVLSTQTAQ